MNNDTQTSSVFHETFDRNVRAIMEPVRDTLIESVNSCSIEEIIAQVLMNLLDLPDNENGGPAEHGTFTADTKARLVHIGDHMGPDWAQALYRAAVFITKVA